MLGWRIGKRNLSVMWCQQLSWCSLRGWKELVCTRIPILSLLQQLGHRSAHLAVLNILEIHIVDREHLVPFLQPSSVCIRVRDHLRREEQRQQQ